MTQGEYRVTGDEAVEYTSIIGSCVATCLFDPEAGVGGMNHFLLPGEDRVGDGGKERYGVHLMELLINGVMALGGRRSRFQAKIFGGARVVRGLSDVGATNATFATRFLKHEGIEVVASDLGGHRGRRVEFTPGTGRARIAYIANDWEAAPARPQRQLAPAPSGEIELFDHD